MATDSITQSQIKELFNYDPATGVFTRLVSRSNALAGSVAGCLDRSTGYWRIRVDGKKYQAHRLAWLYMTGDFPPNDTDHRNLVRDDNRWDNLRLATRSENRLNSRPRGVSKFKGVFWREDVGKWRTQAWLDGKRIHLGHHATEKAAAAAYAAFAAKHFPEWVRLV